MINIIRIPALHTNYIWLLHNQNNECILVDPGEIKQTLQILKKFKYTIKAILLTHNHYDHTNGVNTLIKLYPNTIIYGPKETQNNTFNVSVVTEGNSFILLQKKFITISLPGHTPGHIGFYSAPWLFCGDTVFSAGCGKFHQELAQQMYTSFLKISTLPHNTLIFSGHEYTLPNILFAISILPRDVYIIDYYEKVKKLRKNNQPTAPTTLNLELKINLFFRCNYTDIKQALKCSSNTKETWKIFYKLRQKKDIFSLNQNTKTEHHLSYIPTTIHYSYHKNYKYQILK